MPNQNPVANARNWIGTVPLAFIYPGFHLKVDLWHCENLGSEYPSSSCVNIICIYINIYIYIYTLPERFTPLSGGFPLVRCFFPLVMFQRATWVDLQKHGSGRLRLTFHMAHEKLGLTNSWKLWGHWRGLTNSSGVVRCSLQALLKGEGGGGSHDSISSVFQPQKGLKMGCPKRRSFQKSSRTPPSPKSLSFQGVGIRSIRALDPSDLSEALAGDPPHLQPQVPGQEPQPRGVLRPPVAPGRSVARPPPPVCGLLPFPWRARSVETTWKGQVKSTSLVELWCPNLV